jgi:hypothetical protein
MDEKRMKRKKPLATCGVREAVGENQRRKRISNGERWRV